MNYYKSTYILFIIIFLNLFIYPQQDTTVNKLPSEQAVGDSLIKDMNQQNDSSFIKLPLEQTIDDSVIVDVHSQEDSAITRTPSELTTKDTASVDEQLQQDSLLTPTSLIEAGNDSIAHDTLSIQDSLITNLQSDSVTVDTTYLEDIHPQDISDKAGYVLENSGKWGKLRIYGSLRINGAYDLNGLLNTNSFSTYDIPVGEESINQGRFFMAPYQSRLGVEVTRVGLIVNFRVKIETDFLGANNGLRIRHAFVETGNFVIGQTWSTFTDGNSVPQTVDVDGPNSSVQLRTVRIRYADRLLESHLRYIVSLESPDPDVVVPDSLTDRIPAQFIPDIAGQLKRNFNFGYLSLATIIRGITVRDSSGSSSQILGYGFLFSGVYNLDSKNKFLFQGVYGAAISRFITALKNQGLDLVYNPNTELFEPTIAFGFLGSYMHNWRSDVSSAFTIGMVGINNKDYEPAGAFSQSWYYSANVFWNALLGVRFGLEIANGRRINNDGNYGKATRVGFIFYADF